MIFQPFDLAQLPDLMRWFPDQVSVRTWGGPQFRHPFDERSFREDAKVDSLASWSLVAQDGSLCAFGQYYLRAGRCHLGRLVVAPGLRGRGAGRRLVRELYEVGTSVLGTRECSLFVYESNTVALGLYRRLGFTEAAYPESSGGLEGMLYMVATELPESRMGSRSLHR
ncbi:MAG: GNAT family N-acetyltransferase [Gammaproteobacteria bacterium]|nr:GNAT family N-acetyltransferase [Gammaproteobacteria bacterium]